MPYRFKLDESVRKGFRRMAREQLELAVTELKKTDAPVSSIHESRKALKRLRALIRCCAPALGTKAAHRHNAALRDISHILSGRRDADVMRESVDKLEARFGIDGVTALHGLRTSFDAQLAAAAGPLDAQTREKIISALMTERARITKVRFKGRGSEPVMQGLEASYRKGRAALKAAYKSPSDEDYHELRKAVQTHWRQMALLSRAWPEEFAARVAAAREISQLLGDDHDLAVLKFVAGSLPEAESDAICALCEQRQLELRGAAQFRSQRLFAERPSAFRERMTELWKAGRHIRPAPAAVPDSHGVIASIGDANVATSVGSHARLAAKTPGPRQSQRRA